MVIGVWGIFEVLIRSLCAYPCPLCRSYAVLMQRLCTVLVHSFVGAEDERVKKVRKYCVYTINIQELLTRLGVHISTIDLH